ncbi:zinc finger protein 112-like isoform X2 [Engraulis encrasicolus]|uniref:zinc finger protein 112-like isoform X2 n=1 Tax=Engraulis encrasicolus TaxID=184585 RepID=UPI002FD3DAF2
MFGSDIALPDPDPGQDLDASLSPQAELDWSPDAQLFIPSNINCDIKLECGNGLSSSTSSDEANSFHVGSADYSSEQLTDEVNSCHLGRGDYQSKQQNSGHVGKGDFHSKQNSIHGGSGNYYNEQHDTWPRAPEVPRAAHHAETMLPRNCGRERVQREEVQRQAAQTRLHTSPGGQNRQNTHTHLNQWAVSPLRSQVCLQKQWSRCRKQPPGNVNVNTCGTMNLTGAASLDTRPDADISTNHLNTSHHMTVAMPDHEKRFTCGLCGKRLLSEQTLKSHQKIHTGYAPHQCNQCGKRFSRLENLKVHQNIHTGLKPYTCKFCFKKFNAPSNFNRHKRACLKRKLTQFSSQ